MSKPATRLRAVPGFTLVEVMMAATILTVGFISLIQAVTISSGMMDSARRQSLATQILQNEIENLRLVSWSTITTLPATETVVGGAWNAATGYYSGDLVTDGGNWYRCILDNSGQTPTNTTYWRVDPPPYASVLSPEGVAYGATFTLRRTTTPVITDLKEVTFTITWIVSSSRRDDSGNPVTFTFTRVNSTYFGKYGLNLSYQRS